MKKQLRLLFGCAAMCAGLEASAQWTTPLLIPGTLPGTQAGNVVQYNLTMDSTKFVFFPGGDSIATYSFNNYGILGPTIIWNTGDSVQMNVTNNLNQTTTVHWHGAHVPAHADGGPHEMIDAGTTWSPSFLVMDKATTMWYHPHLHEYTLEQVQMGLAGLIIIQDANDPFQAQLPSTYGVNDIPLILQDKEFIPGPNPADSTIEITCSMGSVPLVNGTYQPVLHVPAQMVRFRMLNGATERVFALAYSDLTTYNIIATDAGYTAAPMAQNNPMMLASGERVEWVTDFSSRQGDTLYLMSYPDSLGNGVPGKAGNNPGCYTDGVIDSVNFNLLMIVVDAPTAAPVTSIPSAFDPLVIPNIADVDVNRTKRLVQYNPHPGAPPFTIDSTDFHMDTINDIILLGDTEMWTLINTSCCAHPFHIHDIHFFIHDINGDTVLPAHLRGPKDVVLVEPNDTVRFITQFTDFASPIAPDESYMYHCHILSHEDGGMMHQFVVVDSATMATVGLNKLKNESGWKVFPNPATNTVQIDGKCDSPSTINLYDAKGALVRSVTLAAFEGVQSISIEGLTPGLWLVQWNNPGGQQTKRLIIE